MSTSTSRPRRWWQSALTGGFVAALAPFAVAMYFLFTVPPGQQEGATWLLFAAIVALPFGLFFGAIGGVIVHVIHGIDTSDDMEESTADSWRGRQSLPRLAWALAAALAGYGASSLTIDGLPLIGGTLFGLALLPMWIWLGVVSGQCVSRMGDLIIAFGGRSWQVDGVLRPALGSLIGMGAGYTVFTFVFEQLSTYDPRENAFRVALATALIIYVWMRIRRDADDAALALTREH